MKTAFQFTKKKVIASLAFPFGFPVISLLANLSLSFSPSLSSFFQGLIGILYWPIFFEFNIWQSILDKANPCPNSSAWGGCLAHNLSNLPPIVPFVLVALPILFIYYYILFSLIQYFADKMKLKF